MQRLEISGAVRHIYIIWRQTVNTQRLRLAFLPEMRLNLHWCPLVLIKIQMIVQPSAKFLYIDF
jgi:hypothetical protein